MKPNKDIDDLNFKISIIERLSKKEKLNILGFFDNESKILNESKKYLNTDILIHCNGAQSNNIEFNGNKIEDWNIF
ncbi:MAG: hypothetical protein GF364_00915 [Candidatus Lokiarchaeota archaeon]|nr:hypothetical protein [Candidatus Lokiarchaeota archaeon]